MFSAATILTVALGIGANTAVFSVINAVLLRPLPFEDPERLVSVRSELAGLALKDIGLSVPELDDLAQRSGVFEQVAGVWAVDSTLTGVYHPQRVLTALVSPTYFPLLGARAQLDAFRGRARLVFSQAMRIALAGIASAGGRGARSVSSAALCGG